MKISLLIDVKISLLISMKMPIFNKSQIAKNANSFLLNRVEYENFPANRYENANYCWHFHIY